MSASLAGLQRDMHQLDDKLNNLFTSNTTNYQASAAAKSSYGAVDPSVVSETVYKTLQDIHRRQRNVVISGLPEVDDVDDKTIFTEFCENNLTVKPSVVSCKRLGKTDGQIRQKPRLLLVQLTSEDNVKALRASARILRRSDNAAVRTVFINPDLTPAQAKLANERRQRRRNSSQNSKSATTSMS